VKKTQQKIPETKHTVENNGRTTMHLHQTQLWYIGQLISVNQILLKKSLK